MKKRIRNTCLFAAVMLLLCLPCHAEAGYRLEIKDGHLAVWDCTENSWSYITDVPVSSLPQADRDRLQTGISAATAKEAASLLEDYCG